jgi:2'-5' RNA ligase
MNIKKELRRVLLEAEKKDHKRDYGCLMVFLDVDKKAWKELQDMISDEDLYTEEGDDGYGRETEPHVTILYGLHGEIEDKDLEVEIDKIKEPKIEFKSISTFENDKFDVLKFDVKKGDLNKLNKEFTKFPHTNKFPDYHPHATIAYLKKGTAEKYIKQAKDLVSMSMEPEKIVYSKVDGTTKNYKLKKED